MNIERLSQYGFILAIAIWVVCAAFNLLTLSQLYLYLGVAAVFLGVKNMVLLNLSQRSGRPHPKMDALMMRYGKQRGILYFALFFIVLFLLIGGLLIYYSFVGV